MIIIDNRRLFESGRLLGHLIYGTLFAEFIVILGSLISTNDGKREFPLLQTLTRLFHLVQFDK